MDKFLEYIKNNRVASLLNFVILLILLLPYSNTLGEDPNNTSGMAWHLNYIWSSCELFLYFLPLALSTIGFQFINFNIWRKLVFGFALLIGCFYALNAFLTLGFPMQDYIPSYGQFATVLVAPLLLLQLRVELNRYQRNKQN